MTKRSIPLAVAFGEHDAIDRPVYPPRGICIWPNGFCRTKPTMVRIHDQPMLCAEHANFIADQVNALNSRTVSRLQSEEDRLRIRALERALADEKAKVRMLTGRPEPADATTDARPQTKPPRAGTVYYLELNGLIKIGWTSDLQRRMKDYTPGSLLAAQPGTRADEKRIHRMFAAHRTHGAEWYAPVPSIRHHIDLVKQKHGVPDAEVGPKPVTIPQRRDPQYIGGPVNGGSITRPLRG